MSQRRRVGFVATLVTALTLLVPALALGHERSWLRPNAAHGGTEAKMAALSPGKAAALLVLVSAAGAAIWMRRRRNRSSGRPGSVHIQVLGATRVGTKADAVVARVGQRLILLGVTESSVTRLAWLDEASGLEAGTTERDAEPLSLQRPRLSPAPVTEFAASGRRRLPAATDRGRSRFGELLRDAVGFGERTPRQPADDLASQTEDRITLRQPEQPPAASASTRLYPTSPILHVEGQAAGLLARLGQANKA